MVNGDADIGEPEEREMWRMGRGDVVLITVSGSVNSIESKWKEPYFRNWWKRSTKKYFYPSIHLWYNNVVPNDYFISDCGCSGAYEMRENFKWKYPYRCDVCAY